MALLTVVNHESSLKTMSQTTSPTLSSFTPTEQVDTKKLWDDVLVSIELAITPANFKTWFRDTRIVSLEDGIITLGVPSVFVRDWLRDKFQTMVLRVLRENAPFVRNIEYTVVQRSERKHENKNNSE